MNALDLIIKKRDGGHLTGDEIEFFVEGITDGTIPDYQTSAFLMAVYFSGMDDEETTALTLAMRDSGDTVDLSSIPGKKIDKHSTGGVGDKTTIVVGPIVAACGIPFAKMSGRGLGFTGGTLDKLESIPGFRTTLSEEEFMDQVKRIGIAIAGQSDSLARADKILYALRDVTGTVDNNSLIASSIMSKKLALKGDGILLDVKYGSGAFMKTEEDARRLADLMTVIGEKAGRPVKTILTSMEQPLGNAVGNSIEIVEAMRTLQGRGPEDVTELCYRLAAEMIIMGGKAGNIADAVKLAENAVQSGAAFEKFREMVAAQGGSTEICDNINQLPRPAVGVNIVANKDGYVQKADALRIGQASRKAGAGRVTKDDTVDPAAGVFLFRKVGSKVRDGDRLARVFGTDADKVKDAVYDAERSFLIGPEPPEKKKLIL